jgi:hypothetical protein
VFIGIAHLERHQHDADENQGPARDEDDDGDLARDGHEHHEDREDPEEPDRVGECLEGLHGGKDALHDGYDAEAEVMRGRVQESHELGEKVLLHVAAPARLYPMRLPH